MEVAASLQGRVGIMTKFQKLLLILLGGIAAELFLIGWILGGWYDAGMHP